MTILWWHWLFFGLILISAELFIPSFTIIWFGPGTWRNQSASRSRLSAFGEN